MLTIFMHWWNFILYLQCLHVLQQHSSWMQWELHSWKFKSDNSQQLLDLTFNFWDFATTEMDPSPLLRCAETRKFDETIAGDISHKKFDFWNADSLRGLLRNLMEKWNMIWMRRTVLGWALSMSDVLLLVCQMFLWIHLNYLWIDLKRSHTFR